MFLIPLPLLLCLPEQDRLLLISPEPDSLLLLEDIYACISHSEKGN